VGGMSRCHRGRDWTAQMPIGDILGRPKGGVAPLDGSVGRLMGATHCGRQRAPRLHEANNIDCRARNTASWRGGAEGSAIGTGTIDKS
jgi:hypothetical protein